MEWDVETLRQLPREYLDSCRKKGSLPFLMYLPSKKVELVPARDTESDVMAEQERILSQIEVLYGPLPPEEKIRHWMWRFMRSPWFREMEEKEKENAPFIIEVFADYMYSYFEEEPHQWTVRSMESVCLEVIPRKVSDEEEWFACFGKVLGVFLQFLGSAKLLNTQKLVPRLEKISPDILRNSQDPANWGIAKSFMMGAMSKRVDVGNEAELNEFMLQTNQERLSEILDDLPDELLPPANIATPNPYRHIGRNDKVSVRYQDGREVVQVKFKKVSGDLRDGKCELIESPH
ncbi:MAG: hypothetical protein AAF399_17610 [Bacteroidota bacterium]